MLNSSITTITDIIQKSRQPTCIMIASELISTLSLKKIVGVNLTSHPIELPIIAYCPYQRGYIISLSEDNEENQLHQISVLVVIVLEGMDLCEYDKLQTFKKFYSNSLFKNECEAVKKALVEKKVPVLY